MPTPVLSNALLVARAGTLATLLNNGHKLKLYSNNYTPTPSSPITAFVECNFQGYLAADLTGAFGAPSFVVDGQYQISTGFFTYTCSGGAGQTAYGWWIDDGTNLKMAQQFDTPVSITLGSPYQLQVQPQEISQSIL